MFIRMLFRRLGWKESTILMMLFYGGLYAAFFFVLFSSFSLYLHRFSLEKSLMYTLFVGIVMGLVYYGKLKLFYSAVDMHPRKRHKQ